MIGEMMPAVISGFFAGLLFIRPAVGWTIVFALIMLAGAVTTDDATRGFATVASVVVGYTVQCWINRCLRRPVLVDRFNKFWSSSPGEMSERGNHGRG